MKKYLLIIGLLLTTSCSHQEPVKEKQEVKSNKKESSSPNISFKDPAFMGGSTLLHFLQTCSNSQRYDMLLDFTSDSIVTTWGKDSVLHYYQEFDFGFKILKLKSMIPNNNKYTLLYLTSSIATKRQLIVQCVVEHDSAKIILPIIHK